MTFPRPVVSLLAVCCAVAAAVATVRAGATEPAWSYPRGGRDPLRPPAALYAGQSLPRITVTLIGVDPHHPGRSLAVVRVDGSPPLRRVVRPGDRIGEYRITGIRPRRVRVAVPGFGGTTFMDLSVGDSTASVP